MATTVTKQLSERAAQRARISMTRERVRRVMAGKVAREELSDEERAAYRLIRAEHQADIDMDLDPAFAPLLAGLKGRLGARRVYELVFHPEKVLPNEVTYPLVKDEVALLLEELLRGAKTTVGEEARAPAAWTLERMLEEGLLPAAAQIGGGSLPRNAYFARHIVAAAYRALFVPEKPEVLKAEVAVAQHQLEPATATYLKVLPGTDVRLIEMAERGR